MSVVTRRRALAPSHPSFCRVRRLRGNSLGPEGGKALAKALEVNKVLTSLNLSDNALCGINRHGSGTYDVSGIKALASALAGSAVLKSINLSRNCLDAEAAEGLTEKCSYLVYEYMEGEVRAFAEMDPQRLQHLETNVTLEMSQEQSQRMVERNDLALKAMERYYSYAPDLRPFAKPLLVNILKAMGVKSSFRIF